MITKNFIFSTLIAYYPFKYQNRIIIIVLLYALLLYATAVIKFIILFM